MFLTMSFTTPPYTTLWCRKVQVTSKKYKDNFTLRRRTTLELRTDRMTNVLKRDLHGANWTFSSINNNYWYLTFICRCSRHYRRHSRQRRRLRWRHRRTGSSFRPHRWRHSRSWFANRRRACIAIRTGNDVFSWRGDRQLRFRRGLWRHEWRHVWRHM